MSHLTTEQRYTISVMISQGESQTNIATTIGKSQSVISHEIVRNGDQRNGEYRFDLVVKKAKGRQESKTRHVRFAPFNTDKNTLLPDKSKAIEQLERLLECA